MRVLVMVLVFAIATVSCKTKKANSQKDKDTQGTEVNEKAALTEEPKLQSEGIKWIEEMKKELSDSLFLRLKRTACFGQCPIYTLSIYDGGTVIFEGEKWVEKEGVFRGSVDKSVLKDISKKANSINFFSLNQIYDNPNVTDLPSTITALKHEEEGFKVIANRYQGPEKLHDFEVYIDQAVKDVKWKKVEQ